MIASEWVRPANKGDAAGVHAILRAEGLEAEFVPSEFVVCEADGVIVGCAQARKLPEGGTELSNVAVRKEFRGRGIARSLVTMALLGARHPVFALTGAPEIVARAGFETIGTEELPPSMAEKAAKFQTARAPSVAMRLRRLDVGLPPVRDSPAPDFL